MWRLLLPLCDLQSGGVEIEMLRSEGTGVRQVGECPRDKFGGEGGWGCEGLGDVPGVDDDVVKAQSEDNTARYFSDDMMTRTVQCAGRGERFDQSPA